MKQSGMTYTPQLRIGNADWYSPGRACKTYAEARVLGVLIAKWWLGVAESDVEGDNLNKRELLRALMRVKRSRKAKSRVVHDELDEIDKAEIHREWRDNIALNHDCDLD